jgi:hypothetical protein
LNVRLLGTAVFNLTQELAMNKAAHSFPLQHRQDREQDRLMQLVFELTTLLMQLALIEFTTLETNERDFINDTLFF